MSEDNGADNEAVITIRFDSKDSVNHRVDAKGIHPNQLFVAAKVCEQLGEEYFSAQRMQEAMTQESERGKRTIEVARSFPSALKPS